MRRLEVWLYDRLVGTIGETRRGGRFAYAPDVCDEMPGVPLLSLSLPVKRRPFGEGKTANWFEGLLPEGARREDVCRRLGISSYDWIGLLAEIGWECAGAVRVFRQGDARARLSSYEPVSADALAAQLGSIPSRQPHANSVLYRMSLGGYQDKMCVAMSRLDASQRDVSPIGILIPQGDAPSTHILKPEPASYPGVASSEAWAMTAASFAARCSRVGMLELSGAPPTLVVERYDRSGTHWPEDIRRIHQEDACQALGIHPSEKYASEGRERGSDPSYRKMASLLMRYAQDPPRELEELLRQLVANLVLGNWDAHAKNTSLLYERPGVPVVSPLYDVVPISEVEPRTRLLSLRIAGTLVPADVTRESVLGEAASWGVGGTWCERVLDDCLEAIGLGLEAASIQYPEAAERHLPSAYRRLIDLGVR